MIIRCDNCATAFDLDEKLLKPTGTKVRCAKCKTVFLARPPEPPGADDPETPPSIPKPPPDPPPSETPPLRSKRYISFRKRLMIFALLLIGFFAVIVIPVELYRPIQELHRLIESARTLIAGIRSSVKPEELARMNEFALRTIDNSSIQYDRNREYYFLAFNMILMEGKILPEEEVLKYDEALAYFGGPEGFDYEKLKETGIYWNQRFLLDKGVLEIFRKYKFLLRKAVEEAIAAGFQLSGIMIMIDSGKKEGFFLNHIAYVVDSFDWWGSGYSGEPYVIEPDSEFWRRAALIGVPGYGHNPIHDPKNWYLPRFDTDADGAWFSVWHTAEINGLFNLLNVDFEASRIKRILWMITGVVVGAVLLLLVISYLFAHWYSRLVTRPIRELTRGAQEVSAGNYDYEVPVISADELGEFTKQFNQMTRGQRERLNLLETMEKFLSKELAEKAAERGLVLGGQKSECTVMFTDFAGFSTITQKMSATESVNILNSYYDGLIPIIKKYGGFPDKYIGDAIVALFGAPVRLEDHAERAVACAIEMQWKMRDINSRRKREGKTVFEMRIGLNSGEVIVGAIGCDKKLEYTSIGETTNLANRMESICDIGHVMMAEGTYNLIQEIFFKGVHIRRTPDRIQVKGYPEPVSAFRIFVDNREIGKNPQGAESIRSFYSYTEVDHELKYSAKEVEGVAFARTAGYVRD